jgi:hypothetical protein
MLGDTLKPYLTHNRSKTLSSEHSQRVKPRVGGKSGTTGPKKVLDGKSGEIARCAFEGDITVSPW